MKPITRLPQFNYDRDLIFDESWSTFEDIETPSTPFDWESLISLEEIDGEEFFKNTSHLLVPFDPVSFDDSLSDIPSSSELDTTTIPEESTSFQNRSYFQVHDSFPWPEIVQDPYKCDKIIRWKQKKKLILQRKLVSRKYAVRKRVADGRVRVGGRFVSREAQKRIRAVSPLSK